MSFAKHLCQLRRKNNITQQKLAKKLGISRSYLSNIENEQHIPSVDLIKDIAIAFNVSCDLLMYGELHCAIYDIDALKPLDVSMCNSLAFTDFKKFLGSQIRLLRISHSLSQTNLIEQIGCSNITQSALSHIEKGLVCPSYTFIHNISRTFNCTCDWLILGIYGRNNNEVIPNPNLQSILQAFTSIDKDAQTKLLEHMIDICGTKVAFEALYKQLDAKQILYIKQSLGTTENLPIIGQANNK